MWWVGACVLIGALVISGPLYELAKQLQRLVSLYDPPAQQTTDEPL